MFYVWSIQCCTVFKYPVSILIYISCLNTSLGNDAIDSEINKKHTSSEFVWHETKVSYCTICSSKYVAVVRYSLYIRPLISSDLGICHGKKKWADEAYVWLAAPSHITGLPETCTWSDASEIILSSVPPITRITSFLPTPSSYVPRTAGMS